MAKYIFAEPNMKNSEMRLRDFFNIPSHVDQKVSYEKQINEVARLLSISYFSYRDFVILRVHIIGVVHV